MIIDLSILKHFPWYIYVGAGFLFGAYIYSPTIKHGINSLIIQILQGFIWIFTAVDERPRKIKANHTEKYPPRDTNTSWQEFAPSLYNHRTRVKNTRHTTTPKPPPDVDINDNPTLSDDEKYVLSVEEAREFFKNNPNIRIARKF
jgi:hypothetical protein